MTYTMLSKEVLEVMTAHRNKTDTQVVREIIEKGLARKLANGQEAATPKEYVILKIEYGGRDYIYLRTKAKSSGCKMTDDGWANIRKGARKMFSDSFRGLKKSFVMDDRGMIRRKDTR